MVSSKNATEAQDHGPTNYHCAGYGRKNSNHNSIIVLVCLT